MESQREVERRYKKLLHSVATSDYYKPKPGKKVNCYKCPVGHITKTKNKDIGVTPFYHSCEKCGQTAVSSFFEDIAPDQEPTQEWYRPELKEVLKMRKNHSLVDHVLRGGLIVRKLR